MLPPGLRGAGRDHRRCEAFKVPLCHSAERRPSLMRSVGPGSGRQAYGSSPLVKPPDPRSLWVNSNLTHHTSNRVCIELGWLQRAALRSPGSAPVVELAALGLAAGGRAPQRSPGSAWRRRGPVPSSWWRWSPRCPVPSWRAVITATSRRGTAMRSRAPLTSARGAAAGHAGAAGGGPACPVAPVDARGCPRSEPPGPSGADDGARHHRRSRGRCSGRGTRPCTSTRQPSPARSMPPADWPSTRTRSTPGSGRSPRSSPQHVTRAGTAGAASAAPPPVTTRP